MGLIDKLFQGTAAERIINHRNLYILGLATIFCGLAWSNALMSIGQFIVLGNALLELNFKNKWLQIKHNKVFLVLAGLYLLHLLGLLWSCNYQYGFQDLRIKIPLLLLPLIIVTSSKLKRQEIKLLFGTYVLTLLCLTFWSFYQLQQLEATIGMNKRELSPFISHIRYGLNIAMAALTLLFAPFFIKQRFIAYLLGLWFLYCLFSFELYTGLACFLITGIFLLLRYLVVGVKKPIYALSTFVLLALLLSYSAYHVHQVYHDYKTPVETTFDQDSVIVMTANQNYYHYEMEDNRKVNGVYIARFLALEELWKEWEKRSKLDVHGEDLKGQNLQATLLSYLSSKGLKKDSAALAKLSDKEIEAIENGIANAYYLNHNRFQVRLHKSFSEIDNYLSTSYANGASLAMRIVYWKTAFHIIKKNFWFGVGTGDVKDAFKSQYEIDKSELDEQYRRRSHNQFLSIWVALGLVGLLFFGFYLLYPLWHIPSGWASLYLAFFLISVLSFFTEDTLETQAGVTFFAVFNSLILLGFKNQDQTS
ncbi:MAG: O-antigen ligase family protein [Vicingaceae bacterium]